MTVKVTKKKLEEALETYAGLVEVYPDNEAYLERYADMLQSLGREATATITLQHLHDVIAKRSPKEAKTFARKYPQIGRISLEEIFDAEDKHMITGKIIFELLSGIWLKLHKKKLSEGQAVYKADELSDSLTLVLEGSVDVYAVGKNDTRILLEKTNMHDIIGEQTFLTPDKVNIDAFVSSASASIVRVPRKKMQEMIESNKHLATMLSQRALFHSNTRIIVTHPVFKTLPLKLCKYLARSITRESFEPKMIIHSLEKPIEGIQIILSGPASYLAKNTAGMEFMLPPLPTRSLVGDIMLQGKKAEKTAKLVAVSKVNIAYIPHQHLINVSTAFPPLMERLIQHAEQQQQQTAQALSKLKHG